MEALIINFNLNTQEQKTLETFLTTFKPFTDSQAFNICKLRSVKNCINDLIVNVALEALYIYEEGGSNKT